jgi:hypothetical protein
MKTIKNQVIISHKTMVNQLIGMLGGNFTNGNNGNNGNNVNNSKNNNFNNHNN